VTTIGIDGRSMAGAPTGVGRYVRNLIGGLLALPELDERTRLRVYVPSEVSLPDDPRLEIRRPGLALSGPLDNVFTWNHVSLPLHVAGHRVDLLHGPFYTLPAFCPAPAVVTIHDITFDLHPEWYTPRARFAFSGFAAASARKARHVLTVSEVSRRDIVRRYGIPESKVTAVPLAADPALRRVDDLQAIDAVGHRIGARRPYLLHVGAISPRRNLPRLLDAFARLRARVPDLSLVLAGPVEAPSPPIQPELEARGLQGVVQAAGYVQPDDLPALYSGAAALVYPSLYEGFGLPVVEAMALGVPVVASGTSSIPEVAGDAALLVDPEDAAAIEAALLRLLRDDGLRATLIDKGLRRAARFSWVETARRTFAVYHRAMQPAFEEARA
jgi:glycosyltransferase involved in cell wall biosynthesis